MLSWPHRRRPGRRQRVPRLTSNCRPRRQSTIVGVNLAAPPGSSVAARVRSWWVRWDPAYNTSCVAPSTGPRPPAPTSWPEPSEPATRFYRRATCAVWDCPRPARLPAPSVGPGSAVFSEAPSTGRPPPAHTRSTGRFAAATSHSVAHSGSDCGSRPRVNIRLPVGGQTIFRAAGLRGRQPGPA